MPAQTMAAPTVNAADAGVAVLSVFCAYDVPGDKPGKLTEVSYCSAGTLQLAQLDCQLHSRLRSKSASTCRCTADRSLIGDRCAGP